MATSAVAAGKIQLAAARGEEIPQGWIVDSEGRQPPTPDNSATRRAAALGGTEGYKGSGLAAMVEVLCGLLTGLGSASSPPAEHNDGCFMAVFNVAAFRPLKDFKKEVTEFARYLKATPPSEGSPGVFYPGEVEYIREQQRKVSGIEVEDATWDKLRALAANTNWPPSSISRDISFGRHRESSMTRQMAMVGFLQAQNCTNLPSSWRHPESRDDSMSADYYQEDRADSGIRKISHGILRRSSGDAGSLRQRSQAYRRIRHRCVKMDPIVVLTTMGMVTEKLGLASTGSTPISSRSTWRAASPPST